MAKWLNLHYAVAMEKFKKPNSLFMSNRKNMYTCPSGHQTITEDTAVGVTPMHIFCEHKNAKGEICFQHAKSAFYQIDQDLEATHEWYKPNDEEYKKLHKNEKEHVDLGGLLLREKQQVK